MSKSTVERVRQFLGDMKVNELVPDEVIQHFIKLFARYSSEAIAHEIRYMMHIGKGR